MCGRFVLLTDLSTVVEAFGIGQVACNYGTGNNIAPGRPVITVLQHDHLLQLSAFTWGLIPAWAKDPALGGRLINARGETVAAKASFRDAFKRRRCLIVADGFYEWQDTGGGAKRPWFIHLKTGEPFGFAGLYETWTPPGGDRPITTCTIITTTPNDLVKPIHHRMPVIIPKQDERMWLDPGWANQPALQGLLRPYPADEMACREEYPVSGRPWGKDPFSH